VTAPWNRVLEVRLLEAHYRILEALDRGEQPTAATIAGTSKRPSLLRSINKLVFVGLITHKAGETTGWELTDAGCEELAHAFVRYTPRSTGGAS